MELREGQLLGLGNPLLDISATVDDKFLAKYDMHPDNAILAEEKHMPIYNELIEKHDANFIAGGSVQNSLRVAQWILKKPNVAVFFGCVGEDEYSKILETRARGDGVNTVYQRKHDVPTGTCAVLVTGSHRSLCANLGAANHFSIDHVSTNSSFVDNADFYYISGFFLTVSPPSILKVAEHALQTNRTFMMNLSAPFISQFFKEPLMQAMPYIDILFGNEMEGVAFAKEQEFGTENLKEIGMKIYNLPKKNEKRKRIVILTQGCNPVLLFENGTIREFPVVALKPEQIVDTNGAGDAFVGGFLSQLVQHKSLDLCIKCGIWAARQIIQRNGVSLDVFGGPGATGSWITSKFIQLSENPWFLRNDNSLWASINSNICN